MDYETDQLNKYDMADAQRYLMSAVKKPDPEFELFGVGSDELAKGGQAVKEDFNRVVVGGVRDAAQGAMDMGAELLTEAGEDFLMQSGLTRAGAEIQLNIPAPRLPKVAEPEGFAGQLIRDFVQFGAGMAASPGNVITRSAFSDAYFDPEEGGFITMLRDFELLPEALNFLATDIDAESDAADRLKQRLIQAGEGAALGLAAEKIIGSLKRIKDTPELLRKAGETIAKATNATVRMADEAGQAADARIADRAADSSVTFNTGVDPTPAIDAALSYAGRKARKSGQLVGAPPEITSQRALNKLRRNLEAAAAEGEPGRFWYERSGRAILDALGGDKAQAEKLAQAIGITSNATGVAGNFDFALQAFLQHKAGQPIKTGRFPASMSKRLQDVFDGKDWEGRKTNNFYINLMREIDPNKVQGVTTDMWMMRAFGFKNADGSPYSGTPTDAQYTFVEEETKRIATKLGWEPQQVQAAIWVANKAKSEGTDISAAAFDYSDALLNNKAQISWESIPGATGKHMPEMFDAPYEVKQEYHVAASKVFLDKDGNDEAAKVLGIPTPGDFEAPGYFEGRVSPGTQTELAIPREYGGPKYGAVEPAALQLMEAYAAVRGVVMKQDGVGFHRPFHKATKQDSQGVLIEIGRQFTERETEQLGKIMAELSGHTDYNPIAAPGGVRLINFAFARKNADGTKAMEDTWFSDDMLRDNKEFYALVKQAVERLDLDDDVGVKLGTFNAQEGYVGNDWSVNKNGEDYLRNTSFAGSPDIQRKVRDLITKFSARLDEVDIDFSERYNFTRNEDLNREFRGSKSVVKKKNKEMILSEAGEAALKKVPQSFSDIPLTKSKLEKSDEVTQLLVSKILEANPDVGLSLVRSGSAAGKSNYLTFATPDGKIGQIRISDHSKGVSRSGDFSEQFPMKIPPEGEQVFGQISRASFEKRMNNVIDALSAKTK